MRAGHACHGQAAGQAAYANGSGLPLGTTGWLLSCCHDSVPHNTAVASVNASRSESPGNDAAVPPGRLTLISVTYGDMQS